MTGPEDRPVGHRSMVVTVGTDHHHFERLIGWAERWATRAPEWDVQIQHGSTRPPVAGTGFDFCSRDRLEELLAAADVVVTHGGPASITKARRLGHVPVVLARDPRRGEHVDNHQQLFVARMAASGLIQAVSTEDDFLAAVVTQSYLPRQRSTRPAVPAAVFAVGRAAEELVARRRRRWRG